MPLFWLSLAFLCGNLTASAVVLPVSLWLGLAGVLLVFQGLLWKGYFHGIKAKIDQILFSLLSPSFFELSLKVPITLLGIAFLLGAARFQAGQPSFTANQLLYYNDHPDEWYVRGVVMQPPKVKDNTTQLLISVKEISSLSEYPPKAIAVEGRLILTTKSSQPFAYGDEVEFNSRLSSPKEEEGFSYKIFLSTKGIYTTASSNIIRVTAHAKGNPLIAALYQFRKQCQNFILQNYPEPQSFLLSGILLGEEDNIPPQLAKAFRDTGTAHIIAISGFNMTLVSGLFAAVFGRILGNKRGTAAALGGITLYVLMLGANAAVLRAAVMSSLGLIARQLGRAQHGLNALLFSAALLSIPNPPLLWDVSFQLSFGATLGLILYAEPFQRGFTSLIRNRMPELWVSKVSSWVGEYFLFTIAAQLTTLPILLSHFERFSLSTFYVNPLILPAQPLVMMIGGASVLSGVVLQPLGRLLAWVALPFLTYTINTVEWFAQNSPLGLSIPPLSLPAAIAYAGLLLGITMFGKQMISKKLIYTAGAGAVLLLIAGVIVLWQALLTAPNGRLSLTMLDVADGDALLLQTPQGQRVLINGGGQASVLADSLGRRLPFFQRSLDAVVLASNGKDSIKALERVLAWYPARQVFWGSFPSENPYARAVRSAADEIQAEQYRLAIGETILIDDEVALQLIAQGRKGAAFLLSWRRFRALLLCGLDGAVLTSLNKQPALQGVTVIWLGKDAARAKMPLGLFARLQPLGILISAPTAQNVQLLEQWNKAAILDTRRHGWVHLLSDGESLWVESQKVYGE